ncbi:L,D-transpeptidase [Candidatus Uhrbacteria bacterium]|nr:L,D-transpeptidase [Candidatus Uhrbacteria bacterium]
MKLQRIKIVGGLGLPFLLAVALMICFGAPQRAYAAEKSNCQIRGTADADCDGLPDEWESRVFGTDPSKADTDSDGYADFLEVKNGFNPLGKGETSPKDFDIDGLDDRMELLFGADPTDADTDGDGFSDGKEVDSAFSPTSTSKAPLAKKILIKLSTQEMSQTLGGVVVAKYKVSTGRKGAATPPGEYKVMNKNPRAWSNHAKLWMPWWMQFSLSGMGIHELPEWPNGRKEGENHLGTPASGGCVRLGVGPAKTMYDWTPVGTRISIVR